ncbi:MAG TPA: hypothetical protein VEU08_12270 [Vicinamibacterales bacterium]|nr:hypothetical protein [Vicinamibacterales bacterium]
MGRHIAVVDAILDAAAAPFDTRHAAFDTIDPDLDFASISAPESIALTSSALWY